MMTLAQFVATYAGRRIAFEGLAFGQCTALANQYVHDVLNLPILWGDAVNIYGEDPAQWSWTLNRWGDTTQRPPVGALVIWHQDARVGTGPPGHIAICTQPGDGVSFQGFSQNWPPNSPCHLAEFSYLGVLGWGVPRGPAPPPMPAPPPGPGGGAGKPGPGGCNLPLRLLALLLERVRS